jgi:hypothetical protein
MEVLQQEDDLTLLKIKDYIQDFGKFRIDNNGIVFECNQLKIVFENGETQSYKFTSRTIDLTYNYVKCRIDYNRGNYEDLLKLYKDINFRKEVRSLLNFKETNVIKGTNNI